MSPQRDIHMYTDVRSPLLVVIALMHGLGR